MFALNMLGRLKTVWKIYYKFKCIKIILILCNGSLVGNGVGSAGASALANIIKNSTSLEEIW